MNDTIKMIYRNVYRNTRRKFVTLETIFQALQEKKYSENCEKAMQLGCGKLPDEETYLNNIGLPLLCFGIKQKNVFSGFVVLTFAAQNERHLEKLRKEACMIPATVLCYANPVRKALFVVVTCCLPNHSLPSGKVTADNEKVQFFYEHAYCKAARVYTAQLEECPTTDKRPSADEAYPLSSDSRAYYDAGAIPLLLEQPQGPAGESAFPKQHLQPTSLAPSAPQVAEKIGEGDRFQQCLQNVYATGEQAPDLFLTQLAQICLANDVGDSFARRRILAVTEFKDKEVLINLCFDNVYGKEVRRKRAVMPEKEQMDYLIADYLKEHFRLRRNELTGETEYIDNALLMFSWRPVETETVNRMVLDLHKRNCMAWNKDVERHLQSDEVKTYNPIDDFLDGLPRWDRTDRVTKLAERVKTKNMHWTEDFHVWMRSMVEQWRGGNRKHATSITPLLIGGQGSMKSTFCRCLLPPELRPYYIDRLDFKNKADAERSLAHYCLINLDEFDSISTRQVPYLKYLQTMQDVQRRDPYQRNAHIRRRYAAFIATTNNPQPLTDVSGSRRYLCVAVEGCIDAERPINYAQLYAQLYEEVGKNEKSFFNTDDETRIQAANADFEREDDVEEAFYETFCEPKESEGEWLTLNEMVDIINKKAKAHLKSDRSTKIKLGLLLGMGHFEQKRASKSRKYFVCTLPTKVR